MSTASRWSLRNIYLYLVCLITLIMLIVSAVNVVRSVVELVYPDPAASLERLPAPEVAGEEVDEEYLEEQRQAQADSSRRWSILSLVTSATMILVAGPLYLYHWRKIEADLTVEPTETAGSA
jgi:hypothetical protein